MAAARDVPTSLLSLAFAVAVSGCGDNILDDTDALHMCLLDALANCEAQIDCGLIDDLEAARCPAELRDLCCAEHDDCVGTLPITEEERYVCIDHILAADCATIEQGPISIETCLGW